MVSLENLCHTRLPTRFQFAWALGLLLLVPISDTRAVSPEQLYDHAHLLFLHGDLIRTQEEAEQGYRQFLSSDRKQSVRFQLLLARTLISRGMSDKALDILAAEPPNMFRQGEAVERLTLEGAANTYISRFDIADRNLSEALRLCQPAVWTACSDVPLARGVLALEQGRLSAARQFFMESLALARTQHNARSEALALGNLGVTALHAERYDEAVDWSSAAYRMAAATGADARAENILGNLGWAYFELGDRDRALELFLDAEQRAVKLGSIRDEVKWLSTAGYVYRASGDLTRAVQFYRKSLVFAEQINSKIDVIDALEDLAHTEILVGNLTDASAHLDQVMPLVGGAASRLDALDVMLAQGEIAAARRQDRQAEELFHIVESDPASQTSMRLGAKHQLARLYEGQGNTTAAGTMYRTALTTFEASRAELKDEESKLPFLANATRIYDDYIHFLVKQGRMEEALAAADQSRAQTLAQGLGLAAKKGTFNPAALRSGAVAQRTGDTVLFYWMGEKRSYLWAITPKKTSLFPLPAQNEIAPLIARYRKELLEPNLGFSAVNDDAMALYRMLVAPAAKFIGPDATVAVVCDGPLSLLNFETLLVPGPTPHYWIEDANVVSAPSLSMLAAAKAQRGTKGKLLLIGDAISPNPDYPDLPMAATEMRRIQKHFAPGEEAVFARHTATSDAYLKSALKDYSYIHFVAHGVASRTDPLDSAIILSRTGAAEDAFKLHAREIIRHPIDAQLVTISACYGGGTRSYAGEGLVGLSWAFLRAGAHHVIGALWEASDDSTPLLMDRMYQGLQDGLPPSAALRQAKLALLHSPGKFQQPFYWAPFQLYAGL